MSRLKIRFVDQRLRVHCNRIKQQQQWLAQYAWNVKAAGSLWQVRLDNKGNSYTHVINKCANVVGAVSSESFFISQ